MSPEVAARPRHIASPFPRAGPCSASSSSSWATSAPSARASSAVPSCDAASTTSTSSTAPASRSSRTCSRIGPIVRAHSFAGRITETVSRLPASEALERELRRVVAAPLQPPVQREIGCEPAGRAAAQPRLGAHAHGGRPLDADAGGPQAALERLVLQRRERLDAAHRHVRVAR